MKGVLEYVVSEEKLDKVNVSIGSVYLVSLLVAWLIVLINIVRKK